MEKQNHVLTGKQLYELKWFCKNVLGCRQDFYKVLDVTNDFDDRLKRLEKTCALIEKFLGEKIEAPAEKSVFD